MYTGYKYSRVTKNKTLQVFLQILFSYVKADLYIGFVMTIKAFFLYGNNQFINQWEKKTLLIVGNGFDLSMGFKTSYGDFMKSSFFQNMILFYVLILESNFKRIWVDWYRERAVRV